MKTAAPMMTGIGTPIIRHGVTLNPNSLTTRSNRIMKYQISKVVVNYARNAAGLNEKDREFDSLAAAAAFLWKLKPKTALEIPVDVCAIIHWDDGTWCGEMWKMTSDPNSIHNPRWAIWNKMAFFA